MIGQNAFCVGLSRISPSYRDGWYRTFAGIPEFSGAVWKLIKKWKKQERPDLIYLFLVAKCEFEDEYAKFIVREICR